MGKALCEGRNKFNFSLCGIYGTTLGKIAELLVQTSHSSLYLHAEVELR